MSSGDSNKFSSPPWITLANVPLLHPSVIQTSARLEFPLVGNTSDPCIIPSSMVNNDSWQPQLIAGHRATLIGTRIYTLGGMRPYPDNAFIPSVVDSSPQKFPQSIPANPLAHKKTSQSGLRHQDTENIDDDDNYDDSARVSIERKTDKSKPNVKCATASVPTVDKEKKPAENTDLRRIPLSQITFLEIGPAPSYKPKWTTLSTLGMVPSCRSSFALTRLGTNLMLTGGLIEDQTVSNQTFILDLHQLKWRLAAGSPFQVPRLAHSMCVFEDENCREKIIMFGGFKSTGPLSKAMSDLLIFDPATESWNNLHPSSLSSTNFPSPRARHCSIVLQNKFLVVFGGVRDVNLNFVQDLEVFNIASSYWLKVKLTYDSCSPPGPRISHAFSPIVQHCQTSPTVCSAVLYGGTSPTGELLSDFFLLTLYLDLDNRNEIEIKWTDFTPAILRDCPNFTGTLARHVLINVPRLQQLILVGGIKEKSLFSDSIHLIKHSYLMQTFPEQGQDENENQVQEKKILVNDIAKDADHHSEKRGNSSALDLEKSEYSRTDSDATGWMSKKRKPEGFNSKTPSVRGTRQKMTAVANSNAPPQKSIDRMRKSELIEKVLQLENQCCKRAQELAEAKESTEKLQDEIMSLKGHLSSKCEETLALTRTLAQPRAPIQAKAGKRQLSLLESDTPSKDDQLGRLNHLQDLISIKESDIEHIRHDLKVKELECNQLSMQKKEADLEKSRLLKLNTDLKYHFNTERRHKHEVMSELNKRIIDGGDLKRRYEEEKAARITLECAINEKDRLLTSALSENSILENKLSQLSENIKAMREEMLTNEQNYRSCRQQVETLELKAESHRVEIQNKDGLADELANGKLEVEKALEESRYEILRQQEELHQVKAKNISLLEQTSSLQKELSKEVMLRCDAERQKEQLEHEVRELIKTLEDQATIVRQMKEEKKELVSRAKPLCAVLLEFANELESNETEKKPLRKI